MKKISLLLVSAAVLVLNSCKKDEPDAPIIPNEEEVITTLILTLENPNGETVEFTWTDMDGEGDDLPVIDAPNLEAGVTYNVTAQLLNELEEPVEDITIEIEEEKDEHQFFYTASEDLTVTYADQDYQGLSYGLNTTLETTTASTNSTLQVVLIHEPNKTAPGVQAGDATNAGGSTDIQANFTFEVVE